jgi:hypothetical protein
MTKLDFSQINKNAADSFNEQRNIIKKIGRGDTVLCPTCQQPFKLSVSAKSKVGVSCDKGCNNIELQLED